MASCDKKETCFAASSECNRLSAPFMKSSKPCYIPGRVPPTVQLPTSLTAENGAKELLIGEFYEELKVDCPHCYGDGCDECIDVGYEMVKVAVEWTTIKEIYKKIVAHYTSQGKV